VWLLRHHPLTRWGSVAKISCEIKTPTFWWGIESVDGQSAHSLGGFTEIAHGLGS